MYALVEIKGRQYKAEAGSLLKIDKVDRKEGEKLEFDSILMVSDEGKTLLGKPYIDAALVRSYAEDLKSLLEESDFAESKAFLRSFIKKIVISGEKATIYYNLPMPPDRKKKEQIGVLPIVTLGGAGGIRTPYLLTASQTFSRLNYSPANLLYLLPNLPENDKEGKLITQKKVGNNQPLNTPDDCCVVSIILL